MHCRYSPNVESLCRRGHNQNLGCAGHLTSQEHFLHVSARQSTCGSFRRRSAHIELRHESISFRGNHRWTKKRRSRDWWPAVSLQNEIFGDGEVRSETGSETILRNVCNPHPDGVACIGSFHCFAVNIYGATSSGSETGEYFHKLTLSVSRYSGDAKNFTGLHLQRNIGERGPPPIPQC